MTRARNSANLASHGNLFVDIANDRTGIGSVVPAQNLHVAGTAGFHADVTFTGDLYNTTWDRSDNSLKFVDNAKAKFGTGGDLEVYHDGTDSVLLNLTGKIRHRSQVHIWKNYANSETLAKFSANGAAELYHDNAKKFETTAYGTNTTGTAVNDGLVVAGVATVTTMNVTGVLTYDDVTSVDSVGVITARSHINVTGGHITLPDQASGAGKIKMGDGVDFQLYHDGSHSYIKNTTNYIYYLSTQHHFKNAADNQLQAKFGENNSVDLYYSGTKRFATTSTGATVTGSLNLTGNLTVNNVAPKIFLTDSDTDSDFSIRNMHGVFGIHDQTNSVDRLAILSNGLVGINTNSPIEQLHIANAANCKILLEDTFQANQVGVRYKTTTGEWIAGVHGGDGNTWKVSNHSSFGTNDYFTVGTNASVSIAGFFNMTCVNPSIYFNDSSSNPDYRLYNNGGSFTIRDTTNGVERLIVDSSGRVLIGTTTEGHNNSDDLTIATTGHTGITIRSGTSNNGSIFFSDGTSGTDEYRGWVQYTHTTDYLTFGTAATERIRIDSNGHTRFGSSGDGSSADWGHSTYGNTEVAIDGGGGYGVLHFRGDGAGSTATRFSIGCGDDKFYMAYDDVDNRHNIVVNGAGNVGINKSNPATTLDVNGTVTATSFSGSGANLTGIDTDLVSDTSPQLGGSLDTNTKNINFGDSNGTSTNRAVFGAASDLVIYHNGNHSKIIDQGTGNLYLESDAGSIYLRVSDNEQGVTIHQDGAVELYHDNTKRLETTANGVEIPHALFVGEKIDMPDHTTGTTGMILLGTGDDLYMYHDGTNSHLRNNTGTFNIRSTNFRLTDAAIQHVYLKTNDSGNNDIQLYYDNVKKFETSSTGVTITGRLNMTEGIDIPDGGDNNTSLSIGSGNDLRLYHDGSHSYIKDRGTGNLYIQSNHVNIDTDHGEQMINCIKDGAVELYHNNVKTLETLNEGIKIHTGSSSTVIRISSNTDVESIIQGYNSNLLIKSPSGGDITLYANGTESAVNCIANGAVELYHNGNRQVFTFDGGMNWQDNKKAEFGNSGDLKIYHDSTHSYIQNTTNDLLIQNTSDDVYIDAADDIFIRTSTNEDAVKCIGDGAVELYHNGTKRFETTSNGNRTNGELLYLGPNNTTNYVHSGGNLSMTADSHIFFVADCNDTSGVAPSGEFIWGGGSNTNTDSNTDFTNAEFGNTGRPRNQYMILDESSLRPANNNNLDLGGSSNRWKTIYTMDLELSNKGSSNSVDGTWGNWTLQEGEHDIFMINNRTGMKFKIKMEAVD